MSTRTPEQTLQKFDHRTGTQEVPQLGGMSRLGDEASIPPRQHHLLVNVRFGPGELSSRPGLVEIDNVGVEECITGLIETSENTGSGGGALRGLVMFFAGTIEKDSEDYRFHVGPAVQEPYTFGENNSVGVTMVADDSAVAYYYPSWWPAAGTRYIWNIFVNPTYSRAGSVGPFFPFKFQGKTCVLGQLGSGPGAQVCIYSIEGNAAGTGGTAGVVAILGTNLTMTPQSIAIREEIIGGSILEVLYIGALDKVFRFDGTTLTQWFAIPHANPFTVHIFASGQEILILVNGTTFDAPAVYYQAAPGQAITTATLPASPFSSGIVGHDQGGWTGACKFRNSWYIFCEGGEPLQVGGVPRTPFGRVLKATAAGSTLTFATVYTNGPGVALDGNSYYHIGWPIVWQDQIVFFATTTLRLDSNGNQTLNPDDGGPGVDPGEVLLGNYTDANGWQIPAIGGPLNNGAAILTPTFIELYNGGLPGWHLSVGNTYVVGFVGGSMPLLNGQAVSGDSVQGLPYPNSGVHVPGATPGPAYAYGASAAAFFDDGEGEEEA